MPNIKKALAGLTGLWVVLILSSDTAFAATQENGQPCPPECVTDSMEIVTWYPSPYNEYEELRLYPTQRDDNYCDNDKMGLMYYDDGGTPSFPEDDKMRVCKGVALGWQEVGGEGFWKSATGNTNDIYYTQSGNVGIGTDAPEAKVHIVGQGAGGAGAIGVITTFGYAGDYQVYQVPSGITAVTIDAYGAAGGSLNSSLPGGRGGRVKADIDVAPGEKLYVFVAQEGNSGNYNGGGSAVPNYGRGGGGASDVRRGGASLSHRIIIAGGGGGNGGGAGGYPNGLTGSGAFGGGQFNGGRTGTTSGHDGSFGSGGDGSLAYGGGGGGGYFGGGGGSSDSPSACGGGGGSGYVIPTARNLFTQNGVNSGEGSVTITTIYSGITALYVDGILSVNGAKNFEISHPSKPGMKLTHSSLEGPEIGVYYRGQARLDNGQAVITLPDYFEALTRDEDRTVQLTAKGKTPFFLSSTVVVDGKFTVYGRDLDGEFFWEVKAVRKDIPPLVVEKAD